MIIAIAAARQVNGGLSFVGSSGQQMAFVMVDCCVFATIVAIAAVRQVDGGHSSIVSSGQQMAFVMVDCCVYATPSCCYILSYVGTHDL
jgi:hypothetical protein